MDNFNEKVNCGIGYIPNSKEFLIYRRGSIVPCFRIPAEVFDRCFGLKENFPDLYAKPVQEENDLVEEAKRNIESCMNLLDTNECQLERAMDAIKVALMDIEDQKCELDDMLSKLDNTIRKLKYGFELSGNSRTVGINRRLLN